MKREIDSKAGFTLLYSFNCKGTLRLARNDNRVKHRGHIVILGIISRFEEALGFI